MDEEISNQAARFAIDGAIAYGMRGINKPPTADHWLMEYWEIGGKLSTLPKDDTQATREEALDEVIASGQQIAPEEYRATLEAENAALRERLAGYEWQDIETAPKDGAWILAVNAATNHTRPHVVHYSERHGTKFPWVTDSGPMGFVAGVTHWMPLPKPPAKEGTKT